MGTKLRRRAASPTAFLTALGASGALLLLSSTASAQHYLFNRANFPVHSALGGMATADFNRDGILDLAVVSSGPSGTLPPTTLVSVLLGKPDGTFQAPVEYQTGGECTAIFVGDFNGDGKPDMVLPCYTSVSVLLGNGDGTFQSPQVTTVGAYANAIATGDFNRDGKLDLAVVNQNQISVLLGNGDGTFQAPVNYSVESATNATVNGLTAGDFNGDGKLDLAVTHINCPYGGPCINNFVGILLGKGDGTFQAKVDYATAAGPQLVEAGDFNGDGKPDLAVVTTGCDRCGLQMVSILLGKGDGTFGAHVEYPIPNAPYAINLGDFNGDGKLDLAVGGTDSSGNFGVAGILLGNGDGTFQYFVDYSGGAWVAGDFNRDGKLDLGFTANTATSSTVSILLGNGDGTFISREQSYAGLVGGGGIATGDFNGDGKLDLAVGGLGILVYLGNGDGTFSTAGIQSLSTFSFGSLVPGDFNRDGKVDLLSGIHIAFGNGDGTFAGPGPVIPNHVVSLACCSSTNAADFNGDGILDVVGGGSTPSGGAVFTFLGNGDGTFQNPITNTSGVNQVALGVADLNRDGKLDVATVNSNALGTISVLLGQGDGTFKTNVDYPAGFGPRWIAIGDFNGDGNLDLAVSNLDDLGGAISILLGNGDGTFAPLVDYPVSEFPQQVIAGDFNGDGKLDLAVAYQSNASFDVMLGNGDGTFQAPVVYFAGSGNANGSWLAVSDFNGDGALDLAVASQQYPNALFVFLNSPAVALYPNTLKFGQQPMSTASAPQTVMLSNAGTARLEIASIVAAGDFAVSGSTCGDAVAAGANCAVSVTFTPTTGGLRIGTLTLTDNAGGNTQVVALAGTGLGPAITLSPPSLTFANQLAGTTSGAQMVTLTNSGTTTLEISGLSTSGDFAETNNCGGSLNAGAACTISVTFAPTAGGVRSGALSVADNAQGSPQGVNLSGTGADFSLSSTVTSHSIAAGETASYTVSVASLGGFSQTVALTCSGAPTGATCTVLPTSVTLKGSAASTVTVTVMTMSGGAAAPGSDRLRPRPEVWLRLLSILLVTIVAALASNIPSGNRRVPRLVRRVALVGALASAVALLGVMSACGGGGAKAGVSGTPAGTYSLTVTATFTSSATTLKHDLTLKLTVL